MLLQVIGLNEHGGGAEGIVNLGEEKAVHCVDRWWRAEGDSQAFRREFLDETAKIFHDHAAATKMVGYFQGAQQGEDAAKFDAQPRYWIAMSRLENDPYWIFAEIHVSVVFEDMKIEGSDNYPHSVALVFDPAIPRCWPKLAACNVS